MGEQLYDVGGTLLPRPFKAGRLGHVGLYVRDLDASRRFYGDLLGFHHTDSLSPPPGVDGPDPMGLFLTYNSDHHAMVLIHASIGRARSPRYDQGVTINQMSFQVSTLQEVIDAYDLLQREGQPIWRVGRDVPGSNWAVYFTDPDGHTVELFYGMEQVGWDRRSKPAAFMRYRTHERPALPQPAELAEVAAVEDGDAARGDGHRWDESRPLTHDVGGVLLARPFKVVNSGPMSLFVADVDAAIAFYTDRMGLALTEEVTLDGHRVAYLRTGTEHHTIVLLARELRAGLGVGDSTLAAYGVQVGSYRQLRDAVAFLADEGCTLVDLPLDLHVGIDYAAHVVDPDGHLVQLYHEMEQVGTLGLSLAQAQRRPRLATWPDQLAPTGATSPNPTFQGPLG